MVHLKLEDLKLEIVDLLSMKRKHRSELYRIANAIANKYDNSCDDVLVALESLAQNGDICIVSNSSHRYYKLNDRHITKTNTQKDRSLGDIIESLSNDIEVFCGHIVTSDISVSAPNIQTRNNMMTENDLAYILTEIQTKLDRLEYAPNKDTEMIFILKTQMEFYLAGLKKEVPESWMLHLKNRESKEALSKRITSLVNKII